jgi:predicted nucleic acid-binding Zn ribbon protein
VIDQDEQLRNITNRKKPKDRTPARLGPLLEEYITEQVSPKYRQFSTVEQTWRQVVPDEMASHCWCEGISGGQLKIIVDSPAYMYRLQVMSAELIERLGELCRRPAVKKIKLVPGFSERQKGSEG